MEHLLWNVYQTAVVCFISSLSLLNSAVSLIYFPFMHVAFVSICGIFAATIEARLSQQHMLMLGQIGNHAQVACWTPLSHCYISWVSVAVECEKS